MKKKNILIATGVLIIFSSLLIGCKLIETKKPVSEVMPVPTVYKSTTDVEALVKKAQAVSKKAELVLEYKKEKDQVIVSISMKNPVRKPIISVQSWLSFGVSKLKGVKIDTSDSAFALQAPYDNTFDNENGLLMLGRSNTEPITDESIHVADVVFEVVEKGPTTLEAYDYRENLAGHTSANVMADGEPYNVLLKPKSPLLVIEN